jgi:hypothetical protein
MVNPDNLALENSKPNTGGFPFYQKNVSLMARQISETCSKMPPKSVCA